MRGIIIAARAALVLFVTLLAGATAQAQNAGFAAPSFGASVGFTADPETFLLALEVPFPVAEGLSVGPLLQLGLSDDDTIVAPTANVRYAFDLSNASRPEVRKLRPLLQGGIGFAYIEKDQRRGDDDDTGFLVNVGGGVEYLLTDHVAIGSNMMFNILPDSVVGENFFFSWQVGAVRFSF